VGRGGDFRIRIDLGGAVSARLTEAEVPAPPPTETIERHTRVVLPVECLTETKVEMVVQLTREAPADSRASGRVTATAEAGASEVILDVHVSASGFAIHKAHQPMRVPTDADSEEL